MRIKPVWITSQAKANLYQSKYNINTDILLSGELVFELSDCTANQADLLTTFPKEAPGSVQVFRNKDINVILLHFLKIKNSIKTLKKFVYADQVLFDFLSQVDAYFYPVKKTVWELPNHTIDFSMSPYIMGILNVTPDSFSDGGRFISQGKAVDHALSMVEEGAHIIDIGGESTRPGSDPVPMDQELKRIIPVIEGIRKHTDIPISIDTYKSEVAEAAFVAGANIVNDISGCTFDKRIIDIIKKYNAPVVIMHIKGTPKDMQLNPKYDDVFMDVYNFLYTQLKLLQGSGIENIAIDPGIGFGKTLKDNLRLFNNLKGLKFLSKPLLIGASRKSLIGKILDKEVDERLIGSLSIALISAMKGADILRVHDVSETKDTFKILDAIQSAD